jgi:hypothetical protein
MADEKNRSAENRLEYVSRQAEPENKTFRVRIPEGSSHVLLIDGTSLPIAGDRIVEVSAEDATAFGKRAWEILY